MHRTMSRIAWGTILLTSFTLTLGSPNDGVLEQLTDFNSESQAYSLQIDDAGTVVYDVSSTNQFGTNPDNVFQIVRWDAATGVGTQVSSFAGGLTFLRNGFSIDDDAEWFAFVATGDLTGNNNDLSPELFVMRDDLTQLAQLTDTAPPDPGSVTDVYMAGDASKVVFLSNTDPLGSNPNGHEQMFVINRDGTGLAQLTSLSGATIDYVSVSDNGSRIVFETAGDPTGGNGDGSDEIFAILSDGTGLRQLTSSPIGGFIGSRRPVVSGDGGTIAYDSTADPLGTNADTSFEVFAMNWDGTNHRQLTANPFGFNSLGPHPVDDGSEIFFASNYTDFFLTNTDGNSEVFKINANGTGLTAVTNTVGTAGTQIIRPAGSGNRVNFILLNGSVGGGQNPDNGAELALIDADGTDIRQLSETETISVNFPDLTADGSTVVFASSRSNPTGGNPDGSGEIYSINADGTGLTQVTNFTADARTAFDPTITGDGSAIAFATNGDRTLEIFRIDSDGTDQVQITSGNDNSDRSDNPMISKDGSAIVFNSGGPYGGSNADGSTEIFKADGDGSNIIALTDSPAGFISQQPRIDASATWVVFESNADLTGGNADGSFEIFRVQADGAGRRAAHVEHGRFDLSRHFRFRRADRLRLLGGPAGYQCRRERGDLPLRARHDDHDPADRPAKRDGLAAADLR